jgi:hypothetical protein
VPSATATRNIRAVLRRILSPGYEPLHSLRVFSQSSVTSSERCISFATGS